MQSVQPVQPLLFWQTCTLCAIAGLLALHWPAPAITAIALLIWTDTALHPVQPATSAYTSRRATLRLVIVLCCFSGAWYVGTRVLPPQELLPPWVTGLASTPAGQTNNFAGQASSATAPRLYGVVDKVQGLTDNRLRITLHNVMLTAGTNPILPMGAISPSTATHSPTTTGEPTVTGPSPLRGKVVWTWDSPPDSTRPVVGETWTMRLPIHSTEGYTNIGLSQWGFASRTQEEFWRVWNKGQRGSPQHLPEASTASTTALWRESLRQRFFALVAVSPQLDAQSSPPKSSYAATAAPATPATVSTTATTATAAQTAPSFTQAQAIVPALLFGDRSALSTTTVTLFTKATLVHSLALSGQHLGVTVLLAGLCVGLLAYCVAGTFLRVPRRTLIVVCALPLALLYLWLGNAPASLQRAACMLILVAFCLWRHRTMTSMDIVCGALLCLILLEPLAVFHLGLQLSALCVISIALVMPLVRACTPSPSIRQRPIIVRMSLHTGCIIARILCISCAIQIALLAVNLLAFHTASMWFVLNIVWLPVLACVVLPCSALALACTAVNLPSLAQGFVALATWPCDMLLHLLHWMDAYGLFNEPTFVRPHWTSLLGYAAILVAVSLLWRRKGLSSASRRLALAGALLLFMGPVLRYTNAVLPAVEINMLDVGQGQALVLDIPHERRLLIDGGGSFSPRFDIGKAVVAPALTYNRAPRAAILINTHPHLDHLKGLEYLQKTFQTQVWLDNSSLVAGDSLHLSDTPPLRLDVLHPPKDFQTSSVNNASLIMRLVAGRGDTQIGLVLFMGDAEAQAISTLLATGAELQAEVLVVAHHGSKTSYNPALYDAVRPRIAMISHALQNRYGSPSPLVLEALEERGVQVYRTGLHGQITTRWNIKDGSLVQPVTTHAIPTRE